MPAFIRRTLKILHELGSIGLMGAVLAWLVLLGSSDLRGEAVVELRTQILRLGSLLLLPSMVLCVLSGLLAIAATRNYLEAGWAWLKALLGLSLFEASLMLTGRAQEALELARRSGAAAVLGRPERGILWVLLAISVLNVVLGVWRPRLSRHAGPVLRNPPSAAGPSAPS